jgi:hypothetical protein
VFTLKNLETLTMLIANKIIHLGGSKIPVPRQVFARSLHIEMLGALLIGLFYDIKLAAILTLVVFAEFPRGAVNLIKKIHQVIIGRHVLI